jgi:hypothetical protein
VACRTLCQRQYFRLIQTSVKYFCCPHRESYKVLKVREKSFYIFAWPCRYKNSYRRLECQRKYVNGARYVGMYRYYYGGRYYWSKNPRNHTTLFAGKLCHTYCSELFNIDIVVSALSGTCRHHCLYFLFPAYACFCLEVKIKP